jgi:hypothetical protein
MVVGAEETEKWRISTIKVIDLLGSQWTHATLQYIPHAT